MTTFSDLKSKEILELVLKQMKTAGTNFMTAWVKRGMPKKITGRPYASINLFHLWAKAEKMNYISNTWATAKHINGCKTADSKKGMIKKGEKATWVVGTFTTPQKHTLVRGKDAGKIVERDKWSMKFYPVFNLDQTTIGDKDIPIQTGADTVDSVENYIKNTGAKVRVSSDSWNPFLSESCFYNVSQDHISMVDKSKFKDTQESSATQNYYSVLLHELTHWTLHKDRCNRSFVEETKTKDGKPDPKSAYAMEELVAEMGSAIQSCKLGITSKPKLESAQYLNIWISRLENDSNLFWKVASYSSKAVWFLESKQPKKLKKAS